MPIEVMCSNMDCPLREKCYRYMAHPSSCQRFTKFELLIKDNEKTVECEHFVEMYKDEYE